MDQPAGFTAHRLLIRGTVEAPMALGEHQGSAIRGALFHAIRGRAGQSGFCLDPTRVDCRGCTGLDGCPVSYLLATVDEDGRRGGDVPRPYTVEPPLGKSGHYATGDPFGFGLTVFGRAVSLFPYVVVGTRRLEEEGVGRRAADGRGIWRQGRFRIEQMVAANPITGEHHLVLQRGEELVHVPAVPVTQEQVLERAAALSARESLSIQFLTPTRLVEDGQPLRRPVFRPLMQRLLERLSSLWEAYAGHELPIDFPLLMSLAESVRSDDDETSWLMLRSYSTRQNTPKYLDGFVGRVTFRGDLQAFLPWLVWGELTHAGKDAVKGCGMYRIEG